MEMMELPSLERARNPIGAVRDCLARLKPGNAVCVTVGRADSSTYTRIEHLLLDDDPELDRSAWDEQPHVFDEKLFRALLEEACRDGSAELEQLGLPAGEDARTAGQARSGTPPAPAVLSAVLRKLPPPDELRRPVAIVVPVYNAYEQLVRMCDSVFKHARGDWQLIAVDDASPDRRVTAYLRRLAATERHVRVATNALNAGFVATANLGLRDAPAGADILLLNSDVEVTEGFLRRIQDTAFTTPDTGIVTPLSNNATIFSLPNAGQDNALVSGFDADEFNRLVRAASPRRAIEIPTAVGFCMYIRREVIERIGWLDEAAFGRGFGEENDYCERAKQQGFRVRICDSQFIFHAGKCSFGAEGEELQRKHAKVLEARHPGYHAAVAQFVAENPLRGTRLAISAHIRRWRHRDEPAAVFLLHADPFRIGAGGTEVHVLGRVADLRLSRAVLVYPDTHDAIMAAEVLDGNVSSPGYFRFPLRNPLTPYAHRHAEAEELLLWIVRLFGAAALCIDHLVCWPLAAVKVLRGAGLPYICVLHDFYAVCPSLNLLNAATWRPCAVHFGGAGDTAACVGEFFRAAGAAPPCDVKELYAAHHALFADILSHAEKVVLPSESSREILLAAHKLDASRTQVIPHGYEQPGRLPERPPPGPALKVGLLGALAHPQKGADIVLEAVRLSRELPIEWHIFGNPDVFGFRQQLEAIGGRVVLHGAYQRQNIVGMLVSKGIDVALFTSVCPETFSFTLSEAYCAGVPPVVPRLGALAERVRATGIGWVIEPHSARAAVECCSRLAREREQLEGMRRKLAGFKHTTVEENAAAYGRLLEPLLGRKGDIHVFRRENMNVPFSSRLLHMLSRAVEDASTAHVEARDLFLASPNPIVPLVAPGTRATGTRTDGQCVVEAAYQLTVVSAPGGVLLRSTGNDPQAMLSPLPPADGLAALRVDITSPAETVLQVYYTTRHEAGFAEERSVRQVLHKGRNEVYICLGAAGLGERLRLDPGETDGDYVLHAMELRHVRG